MLLEQFVKQWYHCFQILPLVWYILRSITLINAWYLVSAINEPILNISTNYISSCLDDLRRHAKSFYEGAGNPDYRAEYISMYGVRGVTKPEHSVLFFEVLYPALPKNRSRISLDDFARGSNF
jgi:hypothetical protein